MTGNCAHLNGKLPSKLRLKEKGKQVFTLPFYVSEILAHCLAFVMTKNLLLRGLSELATCNILHVESQGLGSSFKRSKAQIGDPGSQMKHSELAAKMTFSLQPVINQCQVRLVGKVLNK